MILVLHVIIATMTVGSAIGSVALSQRSLVRSTPLLLVGTLASGVALMIAHPGVSLVHLCVSGVALSGVTIALHRVAVRRLSTA